MNNIKELRAIQNGRVVSVNISRYTKDTDYLMARYIELQKNGMQISERKLGELITTTIPFDENDSSVCLLDGSIVKRLDHPEFYDYMLNLMHSNKYPDLFCIESLWQEENTKGNGCGRFVVDTENLTVRVPNLVINISDPSSNSEDAGRLYLYISVKSSEKFPYVIKQTENYRLWSNGFAEEFGSVEFTDKKSELVTLPVPYINKSYNISLTLNNSEGEYFTSNQEEDKFIINFTKHINKEYTLEKEVIKESGNKTSINENLKKTETEVDSLDGKNVKIFYTTYGYVDIGTMAFEAGSKLAPIAKVDDAIAEINQDIEDNKHFLGSIKDKLDSIDDTKAEIDKKFDDFNKNVYNLKLIKFKHDSYNGYRVYSDGFCEQWGYVAAAVNDYKITLYVPYTDKYYNVVATSTWRDTSNRRWASAGVNDSSSIWVMASAGASEGSNSSIFWHTWGYVDVTKIDTSEVEEK